MSEDSRAQRVVRSYAAGTVVFRDGDEAHTMFVVQSGRVRLVRDHEEGQQWVGDAGPGEFFGEMSILVGKPRSATAVVLEDAKLLELDARTFSGLVTNNAEVAVRLLHRLAQRLDQANSVIEVLIHRDAARRVVTAFQRFSEFDAREAGMGAHVLPLDKTTFAERCGLTMEEVEPVLARLWRLQLVESNEEGFLIRDMMRLGEFQEFLSAREPRAA